MALLVSLQQAACNALQLWLTSQLNTQPAGTAPSVVVSSSWPDASQPLPSSGAVTILLSGEAVDDLFDPTIESKTRIDSTHFSYVVSYKCRRQNVQLDCWHVYDVGLDDIIARLDIALNASESLTMPGTWNAEPVRNGVLLPLADGWKGNVDFTFDSADTINTPDAAQQSEWRASYRGYVDLMLTQTFTAASLTQIALRQKAHESLLAQLKGTDVATVTATGGAYTFDPTS